MLAPSYPSKYMTRSMKACFQGNRDKTSGWLLGSVCYLGFLEPGVFEKQV